jgi:hypothetical protein
MNNVKSVLCVIWFLISSGVAQKSISLQELEDRLPQFSPKSDAKTLNNLRHVRADANALPLAGPRLGLDASLGRAGVDQGMGPGGFYQSLGAKVAFPLLRSDYSRQKERGRIATDSASQSFQMAHERIESLRIVRLAYLDWWNAERKRHAASVFLSGGHVADSILKFRSAQSLVLERDRLEFLTAYALAVRDSARAGAIIEASRIRISSQLGVELPSDVVPSTPVIRIPKMTTPPAQAPLLRLPLESVERQWWSSWNVDAGVSGRLDLYFDGTNANDARLFVAADIPLWKQNDAPQARLVQQAENEVISARESRLRSSREEERREREAWCRSTHRAMEFAHDRLVGLEEFGRVASLRRAKMDDEPLEKQLTAATMYFKGLMDAWDAEAEFLLHHAELGLLSDSPGDSVLAWNAEPLQERWITPFGTPKTEQAVARGGFFVWDASALLDSRLKSFEPLATQGVRRLAISFNPLQVDSLLVRGSLYWNLRQSLRELEKSGFVLDLLLGDPLWLLPAGRKSLASLVYNLEELPFDAICLDMEPEQLPAGILPANKVAQAFSETVRAVNQATVKPISLVVHHRWLASGAGLAAGVRAAGVDTLVVMAYVGNTNAIVSRMDGWIKEAGPLALRVAVSVERPPVLLPGETFAALGKNGVLRAMASLDSSLSAKPNFAGWMIQDYSAFLALEEP